MDESQNDAESCEKVPCHCEVRARCQMIGEKATEECMGLRVGLADLGESQCQPLLCAQDYLSAEPRI